MVNHYQKALKITEEWTAYLWENQIKESATIHNGAFTGNYRDWLARPKESIYALNVLLLFIIVRTPSIIAMKNWLTESNCC